eukprot:scaffold10827_cov73-Skeletonema_marinoi.AAC.1
MKTSLGTNLWIIFHTQSRRYYENDVLKLRLIQTAEEIVGVQMKNSNNLQEVNIQFMLPIPRQSLTDADLEAIKIDSKQIIGFPSNDYKLNHALSGINSASAKNSCVCCMAPSNAFKQLSEAVHRHRNPNIEPPCKDFPHREGENSIDKCHERIVKLTGGGSLPIPVERKREITAKNGSCFLTIRMKWSQIGTILN